MNINSKYGVIFFVSLLAITGVAATSLKKNKSKNNIIDNNTNNLGNNINKNETTTVDTGVQLKQLVVDPLRCIGCGKCARFDSEHFEMRGQKAVVINSKNLSSQNLAQTIRICPAEAITLN